MSCSCNCCTYHVVDFPQKAYTKKPIRKNRKKAGVFLVDMEKRKVLLVQSRGKLWGPPKGTVEENETFLDCAKRELKEETGIELNEGLYVNGSFVKSNTYYYFVPTEEIDVCVQSGKDNDANGIGWFKIDCILERRFEVNQHCKLTFKKFLHEFISSS